MFGLRTPELLVILLIVLVLFGATRLPALARSVGKSARILKEEARGSGSDDDSTSSGSTDAGDGPNA